MKMTEDGLLSLLEAEQAAAYHHASGQIAQEREQAYREYMRLPYGNEEEGRSSVVSSDVFDAVEGMLPDLVEVFVSSDKAVVFDPQGPEDEEGAKQATDACNHVFYKQNNGFLVLYTAAKDALMLKTGGVKWFWEVKRTPKFETYSGTPMEIASHLMANPKAEVLEQEELEPEPVPQEVQAMYQQAGMEVPPQPPRFKVRLKTVEEKGRVRTIPIPADELQISRRHNSILLDECPYVAHVSRKTLSEIQEMGFDVTLDDIKAAQSEESTQDRDQREQQKGGRWGWWHDDNELDPAMAMGWLREEYVLVDFDGDGIAERRKIFRLGKKVLENKETSHVQIAAWTPYLLTHRFDGISVADLVSDFQKIGTELLRLSVDNAYLANNQETVVLTDAQGNPQANIDDLLNRRPGGVMREKVPNAIRPYVERWQGIEVVPMNEMLQVAKENRTGWTRYSQGLDGDSLNQTKGGMQMIMNASQKRMKLMARIMAEALVAPMFRGIFKTLTDYCMEKLSFRLRNQYVQYDPQEWRDGYDMSINVGIGTGDVQQQAMFLQQIAQAQFALMQTPYGAQLVTADNLFATHSRIAENAGFKNPGEFVTDPKTAPPPPPAPPPPEVMKAQIEMQAKQQDMQLKAQSNDMEMQHKQRMQALDEQMKRFELVIKEAELQLKRQDLQIKAEGLQVKAQEAAIRASTPPQPPQ